MSVHDIADRRVSRSVREVGFARDQIFVDRRVHDVRHIREIFARRVIDVDEIVIVDIFRKNDVLRPRRHGVLHLAGITRVAVDRHLNALLSVGKKMIGIFFGKPFYRFIEPRSAVSSFEVSYQKLYLRAVRHDLVFYTTAAGSSRADSHASRHGQR